MKYIILILALNIYASEPHISTLHHSSLPHDLHTVVDVESKGDSHVTIQMCDDSHHTQYGSLPTAIKSDSDESLNKECSKLKIALITGATGLTTAGASTVIYLLVKYLG